MQLNRIALVIGGCHGIGAGIVETMAIKGYNVLFTYRSREHEALTLQNNLKSKGFSVKAMYGDFSSEEQISTFINNIDELDVLIVNAAVNQKAFFLSYNVEDFDYIMKNNVYMPFLFSQKVATKWIQVQKKGHIIFISSIRGETPQIGRLGYCCSKASLNMITKCAAYELSEYGITVNAIAVGLTGLGMNEKLAMNPDSKWIERENKIPLGRTGQGKDIGQAVAFLSDINNDWITGQIITVDGGHLLLTF